MSLQATLYKDRGALPYTAVAALARGDVIHLPDGRAAVIPIETDAAKTVEPQIEGIFILPKTASIALLAGGDAYWDVSAGKVNFRADAGTPDFYIGTVAEDADGADTTCKVKLNEITRYDIELGTDKQTWTQALTGSGPPTIVNLAGGTVDMNIINTNEAQCVSLMSDHSVPVSAKPIFECKLTRVAASNNTLDLDIGLASGVSTTDFEAVTTFAAIHLDGGDNDIDTHSDDNTTDRAPADSTINDVDGKFFEAWIDARDPTNVKFYIDGVLVDTSELKRVLSDGTALLKAVAMIEKTTGTATGEMRIRRMRVRSQTE